MKNLGKILNLLAFFLGWISCNRHFAGVSAAPTANFVTGLKMGLDEEKKRMREKDFLSSKFFYYNSFIYIFYTI